MRSPIWSGMTVWQLVGDDVLSVILSVISLMFGLILFVMPGLILSVMPGSDRASLLLQRIGRVGAHEAESL